MNKNDIKIKNFKCSQHGYVKPIVKPSCPECFPSQPNSEEICKCTRYKLPEGGFGEYICPFHSPKPEECCDNGNFGDRHICQKIPPTHTSDEWKEDLYFEVTEDLIYLCKMFHLARDKKQQTENIRNQQRKLEDFISSLLSTAIKTREEELLQAIKEMVEGMKRNPHNEPRESVAEIYNQALEDIKVKLDELMK